MLGIRFIFCTCNRSVADMRLTSFQYDIYRKVRLFQKSADNNVVMKSLSRLSNKLCRRYACRFRCNFCLLFSKSEVQLMIKTPRFKNYGCFNKLLSNRLDNSVASVSASSAVGQGFEKDGISQNQFPCLVLSR